MRWGAALAVLFATGLIALGGCGEPPRPRNAVLIVLDTLRADRVSAYGHWRETTPIIDSLAREGVLFETAVTNATWTLPALTGLLSGRYPTRKVYDAGLKISLVEHLREAGWETAAFTEGAWFSAAFGLQRGFDTFWNTPEVERQARVAEGLPPSDIEETFRVASEWISQRGEEPFFLVVHTYEPHTPYRRMRFAEGLDRGNLPEPEFSVSAAGAALTGALELGETELAYVRALYDGGAAKSDREIAGLLDALERTGLAGETLLVITSDHGEDLGDHRAPGAHGYGLYDELALVPLIVVDPTRTYPVKRVEAQVRSVDIMHTILDLLGAPPSEGVDGRSLAPLMEGEENADRPAWLSVSRFEQFRYRPKWAIRTARHKLILNDPFPGGDAAPPVELYDLVADPGEEQNIAATAPETRRELFARLERFRARIQEAGGPVFENYGLPDADVEEQLRALGYVQ